MKRIISLSVCILVMLSALIIPVSASTAELVSPPNKTSFYEGINWSYFDSKILLHSDFDLTGTVIKYNGNNINYTVFSWGGNMYAEPSSGSWKMGSNNVKIYLDDFDGVYAETKLTLVAINKVELVTPPSKTELVSGIDWEYDSLNYISLKKFSLDGAVIKVTYTDGTSANIAYGDGSGIDWQVPSSLNDFSLGKNTLELTYCGREIPFEINFVLNEASDVSIKTTPNKITYYYGTNWTYSGDTLVPDYDYTGLKVTLTYLNGDSEIVSYNSEPDRFSIKPSGAIKFGENIMKVTVDNRFTTEFSIKLSGYGDVDINGKINSADALNVLQYSVGSLKLNGYKLKFADVSGDGKINSTDALSILQKSVGIIDKFKSELA